ncbi:tRNA-intron endonuclease [Arthroderma uncinatum]|uniref:tRNA-intron endonuclease n=1 Tax=Arthroderma uncinatum TaxID=74035 RepID=UPI00144ADB86|nr:tRNA-intron endonuclease [Arthroderma uncinatum]KAF3483097.1 tRNA-intron endonuclease [Arthroderma uncinatum]
MDNKPCPAAGEEPELPIPISLISGHYFLFSIDAVTYLRREYNICGVLVGTLPQVPQQNVFLGLPLELMPEEARLLVEKGVAYVIDDAQGHAQGIKYLREEDKQRYLRDLEQDGRQATLVLASKKAERREVALKKQKAKQVKKSKRSTDPTEKTGIENNAPSSSHAESDAEDDELLFAPPKKLVAGEDDDVASSRASTGGGEQILEVTPATSHGLFPMAPQDPPYLPVAPSSYPLFAHLHSQGYFLSPGLRFGCQYMAYPGDPLRFHSHFLVVSTEWDEEFDLMDLVAGGRLGTGVKKGYLIGGAEKPDHDGESGQSVRTFSLEWAGM